MEKDKVKDSFMEVSIEKHETAAWADIHKTKPVSRVTVPSERSVKNAKEYVDGNEK